ncbi:MAG: hypothetical protein K9N47_29770 [Prosthecobacter sp.]|uniref:hypothetical protein n=1 Tax=Prosthecobacter sp. TaxID=1965333 RepID=UPI0026274C57|nr:hypothetical protein [Prosthecobacter sp.]MCF7790345.1 hypothetical protein [Prosthecobacter sp.]
MKTQFLIYPNTSLHVVFLAVILLAGGVYNSSSAQQPEPVPDANGKILYVPSPFPGIPSERHFAYEKALRTLTPEILRALPDDSVLLADLFGFEAASPPGRSPERTMIEMEMWRSTS